MTLAWPTADSGIYLASTDDGRAFDLISMDTLDLLEETESYWIFGFVPTAGDDDDQDAEKLMQK
ncbi:MAG: hypothetical protein OSB26_06385, partial [Woeseiaceae bacterium]|nr:hypothetical protein [Woeseiaceae bacterium]